MRVYFRDGLIGIELHAKPTDTHQYLCMHSCLRHHCKTSIPYSQALLIPFVWRKIILGSLNVN